MLVLFSLVSDLLSIYFHFQISNFISTFHSYIALNLEDIGKTYANKDQQAYLQSLNAVLGFVI